MNCSLPDMWWWLGPRTPAGTCGVENQTRAPLQFSNETRHFTEILIWILYCSFYGFLSPAPRWYGPHAHLPLQVCGGGAVYWKSKKQNLPSNSFFSWAFGFLPFWVLLGGHVTEEVKWQKQGERDNARRPEGDTNLQALRGEFPYRPGDMTRPLEGLVGMAA